MGASPQRPPMRALGIMPCSPGAIALRCSTSLGDVLIVIVTLTWSSNMNEDDYLEDLREENDNGEEWDFTDEDGEEHNTGEYT